MSRSTPGLTLRTTNPTRAVIVMGPPGTGKTTLVNGATNAHFHVDDTGLEHCTREIARERADLGAGVYIDVVDTPALDSERVEHEIAEYLHQLGQDAIVGVIFMLNVNARMSDGTLKSCRMFSRLCGLSNMGNAAIVTEVPKGDRRREELREFVPFKEILHSGAQMFAFDGTPQSATGIIREFADKQPVTLACLGDRRLNAGPPTDAQRSAGATCSCFGWLRWCHK